MGKIFSSNYRADFMIELQKWIRQGWLYGVSYNGGFYQWELQTPDGIKRTGQSKAYPDEDFFLTKIKLWVREINLDKLLDNDDI